tara:strand:- start:593 stop:928 length:336 start_codon:yes stop_codon:yes gene_type:complete
MKTIIVMVWGLLTAQNLLANETYNSSDNRSQLPQLINQLDLSNLNTDEAGMINVNFEVNSAGKVNNVHIMNTFNIRWNDIIIDAVNKLMFYPALQNGIPVKVKYKLPITVR